MAQWTPLVLKADIFTHCKKSLFIPLFLYSFCAYFLPHDILLTFFFESLPLIAIDFSSLSLGLLTFPIFFFFPYLSLFLNNTPSDLSFLLLFPSSSYHLHSFSFFFSRSFFLFLPVALPLPFPFSYSSLFATILSHFNPTSSVNPPLSSSSVCLRFHSSTKHNIFLASFSDLHLLWA